MRRRPAGRRRGARVSGSIEPVRTACGAFMTDVDEGQQKREKLVRCV